jgi:hypothetical protein
LAWKKRVITGRHSCRGVAKAQADRRPAGLTVGFVPNKMLVVVAVTFFSGFIIGAIGAIGATARLGSFPSVLFGLESEVLLVHLHEDVHLWWQADCFLFHPMAALLHVGVLPQKPLPARRQLLLKGICSGGVV